MRHLSPFGRRHTVTISLLLAIVLLRAYVPVGFMPDTGNPLQLTICHAYSSAVTPADLHHGKMHQADGCLFGSAPASGPVSQFIDFTPPGVIDTSPARMAAPLELATRLNRAHPPRAPPALA